MRLHIQPEGSIFRKKPLLMGNDGQNTQEGYTLEDVCVSHMLLRRSI
jgi:hypothetical protein